MLNRIPSSTRARIFAVVGLLALGGFLVAASGIVPIKASSGHWPITEWLLQFAKQRSVATHSLPMKSLRFDEPWLVLKGAGHYEGGCRPCHGSPDLRAPRVGLAMTPPPPQLGSRVAEYDPEELFYIVKHGIKFTGMPAWPSQQRDDEVRAMIAFLLALPELDADAYRELVHGAAPRAEAALPIGELDATSEASDLVAERCARCHGQDGRGRGNAAFPALAGQTMEYLETALTAYARGDRHSGMMQPIAAALNESERRAVAAHYAALPSGAPVQRLASETSDAVERGRTIALRGIAEQRVPACRHCHGPASWQRHPTHPALAGQYADYLELQLQLFQSQRRGGAARSHLMSSVAPHLTSQQIRDVSLYYASLSATTTSGE